MRRSGPGARWHSGGERAEHCVGGETSICVFSSELRPESWVTCCSGHTAEGRSCLTQNIKKDANSNVEVFTFANYLSNVVLGNSTVAQHVLS